MVSWCASREAYPDNAVLGIDTSDKIDVWELLDFSDSGDTAAMKDLRDRHAVRRIPQKHIHPGKQPP